MKQLGILQFDTEETESYQYRLNYLLKLEPEEFKTVDIDKMAPFIEIYTPDDDEFKHLSLEVPKCWADNSDQAIQLLLSRDFIDLTVDRLRHERDLAVESIGKLVSRMGMQTVFDYVNHTDFLADLRIIPADENVRYTDELQRNIFKIVNELYALYRIIDSYDNNGAALINSIVKSQLPLETGTMYIGNKSDDETEYESYVAYARLMILNFENDINAFPSAYYTTIYRANEDWIRMCQNANSEENKQ